MSRLVQKFGGSSVRDTEHIRRVARIVADAVAQGKEVVVVVSAMGNATDDLIHLASEINEHPDPRELDVLLASGEQVSIALLSIALKSLGLKSRSFTGPQAGILTDDAHGFARIKTVQASRLESSLRRGEIPVVAGFQGMTRTSELTTLGRGGSDTTAVAVAAAIKAECCDIYTDVDAVYTADPRDVADARPLTVVSYDEMLALASAGAQVLNARSVELAMKNSVPIRLRSTFEPENPGTLVTSKLLAPETEISGVACDTGHIALRFVFAQNFAVDYDVTQFANLFTDHEQKVDSLVLELGALGVDLENVLRKRANGINVSEIEFSCEKRISREVQSLLQSKSNVFPGCGTSIDNAIARVSLVGYGLHSTSQFRSDFINLLKLAEIPVCMLTASALTITAVLPSRYKNDAVTLLHKQFCIQQNDDKSQNKSNPECVDERERQLVLSTIAARSACTQEGLSILGEIEADSSADEAANKMEALTILN